MYDLRSISKSLQDAAKEILEAKKPLHPNQQKIDVHEPEKDEITAKDFEMLRAGKKAKMKEEVEEEGLDEGEQGDLRRVSNRVMNKIGKKYGVNTQKTKYKAAAQNDAANTPSHMRKDITSSLRKMKEEVDAMEDADEVLLTAPIVIDLKESYMFGDYLSAAKEIVGEEHAIELANYAFNKQDTDLFIEQFMRSDIEAKVSAHRKMGHKVSEPKYSTKSGKSYAEYVVTDKEGIRRKYIHHGSNRKTENMGPVGKRDEE